MIVAHIMLLAHSQVYRTNAYCDIGLTDFKALIDACSLIKTQWWIKKIAHFN